MAAHLKANEKLEKKLDIVTTAIPRPLLRAAITSFLTTFIHSNDYDLRWLFHLDQYPGLEEFQGSVFAEAAELSTLFDEAVLIRSNTNVGFIESVAKLVKLSKNPIVFVEDDWTWKGKLMMHRTQNEVQSRGKAGYNFRSAREYVGAMGCSFWTRRTVETFLSIRHAVVLEADVKRIFKSLSMEGLQDSTRRLHTSRLCVHMGPEWSARNGFPESTRID